MKDLIIRTASDYKDVKNAIPENESFYIDEFEVIYNNNDTYTVNDEFTVDADRIAETIWAILIIEDFILENQNIYNKIMTDADRAFTAKAEVIARDCTKPWIDRINQIIEIGHQYARLTY